MNLKLSLVKYSNFVIYLSCLLIFYIFIKFYYDQKSFYFVPKHLRSYVQFNESYKVNSNIPFQNLAKIVEKINVDSEVFNWKTYGAVEKDTTFILVQVHKDVERLQYLIISLGQVRFVQSVLLIFSHSYYDDKLNVLIRSINFCKVMQIFYPYSLQLHPNKFPGVDQADCKDNSTRENFECLPRNAEATEHKQHWWWKANYVFAKLKYSRLHTGMVIFLEEDSYVAPDLLYMLKYLQKSLTYCPEVQILSFGSSYCSDYDFDLLLLEPWIPSHNKGIAFNKSLWRNIVDLSYCYCLFNDISWSYSLLHLFDNFARKHVDMVTCKASRVISTARFPNGRQATEVIWNGLQRAKLFPDTVKMMYTLGPYGKVDKAYKPMLRGNGGWSDLRDQLLCLDAHSIARSDDYRDRDENI